MAGNYPNPVFNDIQRNYGGNVEYGVLPSLPARRWVFIGDSRTSQLLGIPYVSNNVWEAGNHWFSWVNALNGGNMIIAGNYGISGLRSDQFFNTNLTLSLTIPQDMYVIGPASVNDITQAPGGYTSQFSPTLGSAVTISNVAQVAAQNTQYAVAQARQLGLPVIVVAETGSTSFTAAQIAAMFEYNARMRDYCEVTPGVLWLDYTSSCWNPNNSATALAFKSNVSVDGTHFTLLGVYNQALIVQTFLQSMGLEPQFQSLTNNVAETQTAYSILQNGTFATLTGGTNSGAGTLTSGNVPANWQLIIGANASVIVTSAADASGVGNAITLAITATAATNVQFLGQPAGNSAWTVNDILQAECQVAMASGSSNASVFATLQANCSPSGVSPISLLNNGTLTAPTTA